jgi:hypothetical protein
MKRTTLIPTLFTRLLAAAALAGLVWFPAQTFAQAKGEGASKLIQFKPVKTLEDVQKIEAGDTIVMSCPKCKESYAQVVETSFKGSTSGQLKTVPIHLCDGCETKIVTKGHGKAAKDMVVHNCKSCGSKDVSCCVMKKGASATPGMEEKK